MSAFAFFLAITTSPISCQDLPKSNHPEKIGQDNFLVFPITTELHSKVLFSPKTKFFVLVNGSAALIDRHTINAKAINIDKLYKAVATGIFLEHETDINVDIHYDRDASANVTRLLDHAISDMCARYKNANVTSVVGGSNWKSAVATLTDFAHGKNQRDKQISENAIGDARVAVYPVRTALSRLRTNSDCILVIKKPFDAKSTGKLTADQMSSIFKSIGKLKLKKKNNINFVITNKGQYQIVRKFIRVSAKSISKKLGFKSWSVSF